jgi:hypothetical protein
VGSWICRHYQATRLATQTAKKIFLGGWQENPLLRTRNRRRCSKDFTQYAEGGKVNAAGNYTKPELRKRIVSQVKAAATHGTGAGQWSARKSQLVAKKYKAAGGGYRD